jgi:hypothetical protein
MIKPGTMGTKARMSQKRLRQSYSEKKTEYLELCWHYNLPPRDLSLLLMGDREIMSEDRIKLIRLIIALSRLEASLGEGLSDHLFARDEASYSHSAIFRPEMH